MGKMEKHVTSWFNVEEVPRSYIFPQEYRPGKLPIPICSTIPVIDLGKAMGAEQIHTIQHIMEAAQEFGFFQVINNFSCTLA